ncbi:hypothetical protein A4A49_52746 [Nicotiana attenuata]|uniref:Uncharacterized protein n=1 Tax=Nicotiana attenuata TaxID=49451 RepID=A0A1J6L586_NICAT|nr:hypothetical protein A4A49_52746 [Nicotiana attenuata]
MSISLGALAMIGADYIKDGIRIENFEQLEAKVPSYLLADEEEDDGVFFSSWKINIPTKNSYEFPFCSQEFNRCENGERKQKTVGAMLFDASAKIVGVR